MCDHLIAQVVTLLLPYFQRTCVYLSDKQIFLSTHLCVSSLVLFLPQVSFQLLLTGLKRLSKALPFSILLNSFVDLPTCCAKRSTVEDLPFSKAERKDTKLCIPGKLFKEKNS
jgi:hypothetical protein